MARYWFIPFSDAKRGTITQLHTFAESACLEVLRTILLLTDGGAIGETINAKIYDEKIGRHICLVSHKMHPVTQVPGTMSIRKPNNYEIVFAMNSEVSSASVCMKYVMPAPVKTLPTTTL